MSKYCLIVWLCGYKNIFESEHDFMLKIDIGQILTYIKSDQSGNRNIFRSCDSTNLGNLFNQLAEKMLENETILIITTMSTTVCVKV